MADAVRGRRVAFGPMGTGFTEQEEGPGHRATEQAGSTSGWKSRHSFGSGTSSSLRRAINGTMSASPYASTLDRVLPLTGRAATWDVDGASELATGPRARLSALRAAYDKEVVARQQDGHASSRDTNSRSSTTFLTAL